MADEITQADVAPLASIDPVDEVVPVDPKIIKKAREALAARYDERNMSEASRAVRAGDWDGEPFMLALVDVQAPAA